VADIFRPRLRYSPLLRKVVVSYIDDGVIMVAGGTRLMAMNGLMETFEDCMDVARGRGMRFSVLKTEWIGMGKGVWPGLIVLGIPEGLAFH